MDLWFTSYDRDGTLKILESKSDPDVRQRYFTPEPRSGPLTSLPSTTGEEERGKEKETYTETKEGGYIR